MQVVRNLATRTSRQYFLNLVYFKIVNTIEPRIIEAAEMSNCKWLLISNLKTL
jgi:hypothetical protein